MTVAIVKCNIFLHILQAPKKDFDAVKLELEAKYRQEMRELQIRLTEEVSITFCGVVFDLSTICGA